MQRQHKWRWRRGGWRRNAPSKSTPPTAPMTETESQPSPLEREAVRLLREWRDMQEVISYSQEITSRRHQQLRETESVPFEWDANLYDGDFGTTRRVGVDGIRERLRGRGEV